MLAMFFFRNRHGDSRLHVEQELIDDKIQLTEHCRRLSWIVIRVRAHCYATAKSQAAFSQVVHWILAGLHAQVSAQALYTNRMKLELVY
jgi:hypothetical protein